MFLKFNTFKAESEILLLTLGICFSKIIGRKIATLLQYSKKKKVKYFYDALCILQIYFSLQN